jgi:hypothetical protein
MERHAIAERTGGNTVIASKNKEETTVLDVLIAAE